MLSTTFLESGVIREIDRLLSGRVTWELVVSARSFHPAGCQNGERIRWIVSTQGFVPKMLESLRGLSCGLVGQNSNQTVRFHTPKPRITNFGPT